MNTKNTELPVLTKPPSNPCSHISCLQHDASLLSRFVVHKKNQRAKIPLFRSIFFVLANISTNFQNCVSVPVLHCIVFLYIKLMMKIVNNTNNDRFMAHLHQNMERHTRSHV